MFDNGGIGKRVAVIGARPSGLAAGLALHNKGYDVRVLERNASIKPIGGAILLNTSVLMCLRKMGVDITDLALSRGRKCATGTASFAWICRSTPTSRNSPASKAGTMDFSAHSYTSGCSHTFLRNSWSRRAVVFLASPARAIITGQTLVVDGGTLIGD